MEKVQAKSLIERTFNNRFNKENFRNFIINFLDGINESKAFSVGQAQVKEAFQKYILSYQRIGQYTDSDGNIIDACLKALMKRITIRTSRSLVQKRKVYQLMAKRYRSAVSGQFVKKDYAVKHPKTTVAETIKKKN